MFTIRVNEPIPESTDVQTGVSAMEGFEVEYPDGRLIVEGLLSDKEQVKLAAEFNVTFEELPADGNVVALHSRVRDDDEDTVPQEKRLVVLPAHCKVGKVMGWLVIENAKTGRWATLSDAFSVA